MMPVPDPSHEKHRGAPRISIVIPVFNEANSLGLLFDRLTPILRSLNQRYEIVFVNDGSADDTLRALLNYQPANPELRVIDLSRNFGKEAALTAGLAHCRGDCAITLDADLQDPPELIPQMIAKWGDGYETVVAVHAQRSTDSYVRRTSANWFYRLINAIAEIRFVAHAGDFRLLDRSAINAFLSLPERTRFNKGLFAWIGFRSAQIEHHRPARSKGHSRFSLRRLTRFAIDGITSFSTLPLRVWTYVGFSIAFLAFCYGSYIILRTLVMGIDVPGYASMIVAIMFFGGINLLGIGVLGEYIGRIFLETKHRPLYVVRRIHESSARQEKD